MNKRGGKTQTHTITRNSGLKTITRNIGLKKRKSAAQQVMKDSGLRMNVLNVLISDIHKEMTVMCSRKTNSKSTPEAMAGFTWESIMEELEAYAPTLLSILSGCVKAKRRVRKGFAKRTENKRQRRWKRKSNRCAKTAVLGVCAAIIFCNRNMLMNLVQRIISVLFNSGHASKQVSILFV